MEFFPPLGDEIERESEEEEEKGIYDDDVDDIRKCKIYIYVRDRERNHNVRELRENWKKSSKNEREMTCALEKIVRKAGKS